ncbi:trypsin 3A1-like [Uranotaenia lowii]|uniref:trypsin 3A1-like n=1 Tax=Uranotaenia lowii TaxID=190385 RepID=UPI0024793862|nr:trypsin 3A1-like [Uranotaenia lowii]
MFSRTILQRLLVISVFYLVFVGVDPTRAYDNEDDERIVGGVQMDIEDVPYQASLHMDGSIFCGGSVLRPHIILTASHCFVGVSSARGMTVRAGSSYPNKGGQVLRVKQFIRHPQFSKDTLDFDVAIVYMEGSFRDPAIKQIKLSSSWSNYNADRMGTVSGFGMIRNNGELATHLLGVNVPIIDWNRCERIYRSKSFSRRMFCAGYPGGKKDACTGDSGGPFVLNRELVGIVSWGVGCADGRYPGVYTNVLEVKDWIKSHIK